MTTYVTHPREFEKKEDSLRADRLISLILALQDQGKTTAARLAGALGVSRRTILRDVDALSLSGVPVLAEGGPGGGIWLDPAYRSSLTGMKEAELRTLLVAGDARLLDDLGWGQTFRETQAKLRASVPRRFESGVERLRRRLVIDSRWWWHEAGEPNLEVLQAAVWEDRVIEGDYQSWEGGAKAVRLEAYGLAAKAGLWYFVGRREGEWRTYRVSRFASLRAAEAFARDPQFDLSTWWPAHAAEFAGEMAGFRFSLALPEDRLRYLRGIAPGRVDPVGPWGRPGWVRVELGLDSSLYAELVVLGLGRRCAILDNPQLAKAVVRRCREGLAAHENAPRGRA
ncbi:MAG TPA: WYL domain-containing protein [Spirochaetales bacterium]|nr:WYL domain-containing protein [Spirochaetales bacterium]HRY56435.1 WYL domain-containing protein [Spirochaetia bacterium]HRZ63909.1 WYL domain-containing protein [Spirochaetia bacterium]